MPPDTMTVSVSGEASLCQQGALPLPLSSAGCSRPRTPAFAAVASGTGQDQHAQVTGSALALTQSWSQLLGHCSRQVQLVVHPVPHFKQLFSWDCGLACALMALKAVGLHQCDYAQLRQLCPTTSIWTIDLAHLLRRYGLDVTFFTITLGPNPAFYNESFYLAHMQEDERRVSQLFHDAPSAGIYLAQRSVCWQELAVQLMAGSSLVIVLVDKRKLDPWLMAADMCLPYALCGMDLGYTGHYILLVGWDAAAGQFLAHDPSADGPGEVRVTPAALDAARSAFGTDEDVLLVRHAALAQGALIVPQSAPAQAAAGGGAGGQQQQQQPAGATGARGCCCPVRLEELYKCAVGPGSGRDERRDGWRSGDQAGAMEGQPQPHHWQHAQQQHHSRITQQPGAGGVAAAAAQQQQPDMQQQWQLVGLSRHAGGTDDDTPGRVPAGLATGGLVRPELLIGQGAAARPGHLMPLQDEGGGAWWAAGGTGHPLTTASHSFWHASTSEQRDEQLQGAGAQTLDARQGWASSLAGQGLPQQAQPQHHSVDMQHAPDSQHQSHDDGGHAAGPCPSAHHQQQQGAAGSGALSGLSERQAEGYEEEQGAGGWAAAKPGTDAAQVVGGAGAATSPPSSAWTTFWCWAPTWTTSTVQQGGGNGSSSTSSTSSSSCHGDSQSSGSSRSSCDSQRTEQPEQQA